MNKKLVHQTIEVLRIYKKATAQDPVPGMPQDGEYSLLEALEEIASVDNIEALRLAINVLCANESTIVAEQVAKLRGLLVSVQVPKEVIYAYPVTMNRHFIYYSTKFDRVYLIEDSDKQDEFGCLWRTFIAPKEAIDYLRENNVPIKVIE